MPNCGGFAPLFSLRDSLCTSAREEDEEEEEEKALEPPETLNPVGCRRVEVTQVWKDRRS
jgi:hypothetical protein